MAKQEAAATGKSAGQTAVSKIKLSPYNPRKISARMREQLEQSLDTYGLVEPLVVNRRTMHVVGGNQRLTVLKARKVKTVATVFVDLDDNREKALNIVLNKITADWDPAALKSILRDLAEGAVTGFDTDEIEFYLEAGTREGTGDDGEGDAAPQERVRIAPEKDPNDFPYMVYFTFKSAAAAQAFVEQEGFPTRVEDGKHITRVRVTYDRKGQEKVEL